MLQVGLPTNFRTARFGDAAANEMLADTGGRHRRRAARRQGCAGQVARLRTRSSCRWRSGACCWPATTDASRGTASVRSASGARRAGARASGLLVRRQPRPPPRRRSRRPGPVRQIRPRGREPPQAVIRRPGGGRRGDADRAHRQAGAADRARTRRGDAPKSTRRWRSSTRGLRRTADSQRPGVKPPEAESSRCRSLAAVRRRRCATASGAEVDRRSEASRVPIRALGSRVNRYSLRIPA